MDREKVIKGLEYCITHYNCRNYRKSDCPYLDLCAPIEDANGNRLMRDALAILKEDCHNCKLECMLQKYDELKEKYDALLNEQERKKGSWDYGTQCSVCKGTIIPPKDRKVRVNFCPWCGADMHVSYE